MRVTNVQNRYYPLPDSDKPIILVNYHEYWVQSILFPKSKYSAIDIPIEIVKRKIPNAHLHYEDNKEYWRVHVQREVPAKYVIAVELDELPEGVKAFVVECAPPVRMGSF